MKREKIFKAVTTVEKEKVVTGGLHRSAQKQRTGGYKDVGILPRISR